MTKLRRLGGHLFRQASRHVPIGDRRQLESYSSSEDRVVSPPESRKRGTPTAVRSALHALCMNVTWPALVICCTRAPHLHRAELTSENDFTSACSTGWCRMKPTVFWTADLCKTYSSLRLYNSKQQLAGLSDVSTCTCICHLYVYHTCTCT